MFHGRNESLLCQNLPHLCFLMRETQTHNLLTIPPTSQLAFTLPSSSNHPQIEERPRKHLLYDPSHPLSLITHTHTPNHTNSIAPNIHQPAIGYLPAYPFPPIPWKILTHLSTLPPTHQPTPVHLISTHQSTHRFNLRTIYPADHQKITYSPTRVLLMHLPPGFDSPKTWKVAKVQILVLCSSYKPG